MNIPRNPPIRQDDTKKIQTLIRYFSIPAIALILGERQERIIRWSQGKGLMGANERRRINQFFKATSTKSGQLFAMLARAQSLEKIMGDADYAAFLRLAQAYIIASWKKRIIYQPPVGWQFYRDNKHALIMMSLKQNGRAIVRLLERYDLNPHNRPDSYIYMALTPAYHQAR